MSFSSFPRLCSCIILYLYHSLSAFVSFSIRWTLLQRSVKRAQAGMLKAPSGWKWKLQSPAPFVSQVPLYSMDQRSDCGKNPMFHRVFIMFHHVSSLNCNTTVQWPWWGTWHVSSDWLERKHVSIVQILFKWAISEGKLKTIGVSECQGRGAACHRRRKVQAKHIHKNPHVRFRLARMHAQKPQPTSAPWNWWDGWDRLKMM